MSVTLLVRVSGKPGHGEVLAGLLRPVSADNDIAGCLGVEVFASTTDPDELLLLEHWSSVEAHQTFLAGVVEQGGLDRMMRHAARVTRTYLREAPG